jgi:hypothetical protein
LVALPILLPSLDLFEKIEKAGEGMVKNLKARKSLKTLFFYFKQLGGAIGFKVGNTVLKLFHK